MTQIKEHTEYYVTESGDIYSTINNAGNTRNEPYLLKQTLGRDGYYWVGLKGSNKRIMKVHRLVAITFLPNPNLLPVVNHIDGNKLNNDVSNLEWVTHKENAIHAHQNGLTNVAKGEQHKASKLKDAETIELIQLILDGYTNDELAEIYGLHSRYISLIRHKHRQKHIWNTYFPEQATVCSDKSSKQRDTDVIKAIVDMVFTTELSNSAIGKHFNIDPSTVSRIRSNDPRVQSYFKPFIQKYLNNEGL